MLANSILATQGWLDLTYTIGLLFYFIFNKFLNFFLMSD